MKAIETLVHDLAGDTYTRLQARQELELIGEECVPKLIEVLQKGGRGAWEAGRLLGKWRIANALPMLVRALREDDPVLGQIAVAALDQIESLAMTRTFIEVLPHAHCMIQLDLISALERRGNPEALPVLCELLTTHASNMIRMCLIQAIGTLGNGSEISLIMQYQDDEDAHIRKRAHIALTRLQARLDNVS